MWQVEIGGVINGYFKRNIYIDPNKIDEYREKFNNTDVYITPYLYDFQNDTNPSSCPKIADLYFDFDISDKSEFKKVQEDAIRTIQYLNVIFKIDKRQVEIFFSGNKGIHLVVNKEILNIQPNCGLNKIFKAIADEVFEFVPNKTLDKRIYDARRLFRIENSINSKSGLYKIPISYEELKYSSYEEICSLAKNPRYIKYSRPIKNTIASLFYQKYVEQYEFKQRKIEQRNKKLQNIKPRKLDRLPPCIENILNNKTLEGNRNNTSIILASFFANQGYSFDEIYEILNTWNLSCCNPPLPDDEIAATIKSEIRHGYNYGCLTLRSISVCNFKECPLFSKGGVNGGQTVSSN